MLGWGEEFPEGLVVSLLHSLGPPLSAPWQVTQRAGEVGAKSVCVCVCWGISGLQLNLFPADRWLSLKQRRESSQETQWG